VQAVNERSKAVETGLEKLLSAAQARRFREIMLQALTHAEDARLPLNSSTVLSPVSYAGVAAAVKLTDEQKQQLISLATPDRVRISPDRVLTRDQKTAIAKMLGEPFKGTFPNSLPIPPRPAPQRVTTPPLIRLSAVNSRSLVETLKLTPEQTKTVDVARAMYQTAVDGVNGVLLSQRRAAETASGNAVEGVLTADQDKRVKQLIVQLDAATSLATTLTTPEMAKTLELTSDQTEDVLAVADEVGKLRQWIVTEGVPDPEQKLAFHLRDVADNQMLATLTDVQKAKWKELTGEPWRDLQKKPPLPGRIARP
jgi:hypothetical protein